MIKKDKTIDEVIENIDELMDDQYTADNRNIYCGLNNRLTHLNMRRINKSHLKVLNKNIDKE